MYRLATKHSATDRQTDRRQYHANSQPYSAAVRSAKNTASLCKAECRFSGMPKFHSDIFPGCLCNSDRSQEARQNESIE